MATSTASGWMMTGDQVGDLITISQAEGLQETPPL